MAESAKNFKFISPGIRVSEIDRSQIPDVNEAVGPIIIGRARKGPAFKPVKIGSFSEFVETFGEPVAGGTSNDVWRDGNFTSPMYGSYAAQAWLRNGEVCTYMRVLGDASADATTDAGKAGWKIGTVEKTNDAVAPGGAFGLFVMPSSSLGANGITGQLTGALVSVFYMASGSGAPKLSGSLYGISGHGVPAVSSSNSMLIQSNASSEFVIEFSGSNLPSNKISFSLNKNKGNFIRKVFNTDPTLLGRKNTDSGKVSYFLGETFEDTYSNTNYFTGSGATSAATLVGVILGLKTGSAISGEDAEYSVQQHKSLTDNTLPKSGWFFTQALTNDTASYDSTSSTFLTDGTVKRLFRFVGLDTGEYLQNNFKVSLSNIRYSKNEDVDPFGSFNVEIRKMVDNDSNPRIVESFGGCNLNVNSENYILNKIGDKYVEYDADKRKVTERGEYENKSKYVRVEINSEFEAGFDSSHVPFGLTGPTKFKTVSFSEAGVVTSENEFVIGGSDNLFGSADTTGSVAITGSGEGGVPRIALTFPEVTKRTATTSLNSIKQAYWGALPVPDGTNAYEQSTTDHLRIKPTGVTNHNEGINTVYQWVVSLDDIKYANNGHTGSSGLSDLVYSTSSRSDGYSLTATGSLSTNHPDKGNVLQSYKAPLALGVNKLTSLFYGGTDGFNIIESDPLRNSAFNASPTLVNDSKYYTLRRAIDSVKHPEILEYNLASVPGMTNESLNKLLIENCEERSDALAVIDIAKGYIPTHERLYDSTVTSTTQIMGDLSGALDDMVSAKYNSSYGSVYYPWVQIRDSVNIRNVWVPPSVVAIGAMAYTDRVQAPWFAPAGFTRGGLSNGVSGFNVLNSSIKLFAEERDTLYSINVNPIASFPNEGVVIFGQKTLQTQRSALDRINVRRLMLFLKREISIIATTVLFEQNVEETWTNFKNQAEPLLADVKARFGLTDYKLVLDSTTTTPDLIDQNIMYAKVFVKPARAIEYIAIDFFITNTGASFND